MITIEQRKAPRKETRKVGVILLTNGGGMRCVVRNMSAFGACLEVLNHFGVPLDIILVIAGERLKRRCRIVWRSNNQLGVLFG
jgi:hypothetical protein